MEKEKFFRSIGLPSQIIEAIQKHPLTHEDYLQWKNLFLSNKELFLKELQHTTHGALLFLLLASKLAFDLVPSYKAQGIPEHIYTDTFRDIAIWQADHKKKTGTLGLSQYTWICKILHMEVIRLGRLEFEPLAKVPQEIRNHNHHLPNTNCYSVHIPADGSLDPDECNKSYRIASQYFQEQAPLCFCQSWLLSPALKNLLPETSNILSFQQSYHIFHIDETSRQAEERLFGTLLEDPKNYQATTSLQKHAKQWLLQGKTIPSGWGILK